MTIARLLRIWRQRIRSLIRKDAVDAEVSHELAFHFDLLVAEHVASGMPLDDARRAARRALGNVAVIEEQCRDQRRVSWAHDLRQDLSCGLRVLAKSPVFTLVAAASLAIGLGANAATLGVLHSLRVQPLALPEADRLVVLRSFSLANPAQLSGISLSDYLAWRERSRTIEAFGMTLGAPGDLSADGGEPAERIDGHLFDAGAVSALGVRPFLGRVFTDDDPRFGTPGSVIVISHRLWTERYGADLSIAGRQIRLNRSLVTIIGVMPPSFVYPDNRTDYWGPMWTLRPGARDDVRLYNVLGRLRPGVSIEEAEADLQATTGGQWGVRARPLREILFGWATAPLVTVEAAVALVLLMACANVAALLLARGTVRGPELALRMALGAGRGRIIRQLLTESVLLSCIGGGLGLFVAAVSVQALRTLAPLPGQSSIPPVAIDARLLAITAVLAVGTALVFGVVPAFRSSRMPLVDQFKGLQRTVDREQPAVSAKRPRRGADCACVCAPHRRHAFDHKLRPSRRARSAFRSRQPPHVRLPRATDRIRASRRNPWRRGARRDRPSALGDSRARARTTAHAAGSRVGGGHLTPPDEHDRAGSSALDRAGAFHARRR